jgi:hypothetical protein
MKKIIFLTKVFLTFLLVVSVSLGAFAQSGNGTQSDPYLISSTDDLMSLYAFASSDATDGAYFVLTNDIDLANENWAEYVIGTTSDSPFRGIFRGNGYKITGFNLESEASAEKDNYYGFFGVLGAGAEITDLHIEGQINITGPGKAYVGALASYIRETSTEQSGTIVTIRNCSSNVIIASNVDNTSDDYSHCVGGIVGRVLLNTESELDALITGCANRGNISGNFLCGGGIVGNVQTFIAANDFTLSNCYNSGEIRASNHGNKASYIGGIAGRFVLSTTVAGPQTIEKSFNTGNVIGESTVRTSGILMYASGRTGGQPITIRNCAIACDLVDTAAGEGTRGAAYRIQSYGAGNIAKEKNYALASILVNGTVSSTNITENLANGASKTLDEMQTQATYEELDWDFTDVWKMDTETNLPVLKLEYTPVTNIQKLAPTAIKTSVIDNTLKVTGLSAGQSLNVYNAQGALIYNAIAQQPEVNLPLSSPGVYIVKAGETSVKIIR